VDALFLDLEDAVAPAVKAESRARIVRELNGGGFKAPVLTVRVNGWETPWTYADVIEVVSGAGARISALVLPKTTSAAQVQALDYLLTQVERNAGLPVGRIGIEVQIEDALGLLHVGEIAAASPRLVSLVFGPGDFMASMGMASLNVGAQPQGYPADAFHHALMSILVAARAHGLLAIDGPFVAIRDVDGFRRSAESSAALGFDGKWVLHPAQVDAGNVAFTPRVADFERAERIMTAYAQAAETVGGAKGAIVVDDEMIDEAGVKLAAATYERGRAAGME
jgi:citrate lyase subunit beta/citryl-CoA lyase